MNDDTIVFSLFVLFKAVKNAMKHQFVLIVKIMKRFPSGH